MLGTQWGKTQGRVVTGIRSRLILEKLVTHVKQKVLLQDIIGIWKSTNSSFLNFAVSSFSTAHCWTFI